MNNTPSQLSQHLYQVHFGGNWTWSNLKDNLADVTWEQAIKKVGDFNTIATLTFHINYFVEVVNNVLEGNPLKGDDKLSFDHPPIQSKEDWDKLVNKVLADGEKMTALIEKFPEEKLWENIGPAKYGNYFRNLLGVIEHTHYHLGQIAILKKMVQKS